MSEEKKPESTEAKENKESKETQEVEDLEAHGIEVEDDTEAGLVKYDVNVGCA